MPRRLRGGSWRRICRSREARALAEALRSSGVACGVGPTAALAALPAVEPAGTLDALPAAQPVLIAVAGITVTTTTTRTEKKGPSGGQKLASTAIMMTTGLPIKIGGRKRSVEKTHEEQSLAFYADLYYEDPSRRLQIDSSRFDFSCLGPRMLYQAQGNLKLLIGDLVRSCTGSRDESRDAGSSGREAHPHDGLPIPGGPGTGSALAPHVVRVREVRRSHLPRVKPIYEHIGAAYRRVRREDPRLARVILDALGDGDSVANVGAGTGSYEPRDRLVVAVEPSITMLRERPQAGAFAVRAAAGALPLRDGSVSASLAVLTVHHWANQDAGLAELCRVARERVVIVTWDPESTGFWLTADYFPEFVGNGSWEIPDPRIPLRAPAGREGDRASDPPRLPGRLPGCVLASTGRVPRRERPGRHLQLRSLSTCRRCGGSSGIWRPVRGRRGTARRCRPRSWTWATAWLSAARVGHGPRDLRRRGCDTRPVAPGPTRSYLDGSPDHESRTASTIAIFRTRRRCARPRFPTVSAILAAFILLPTTASSTPAHATAGPTPRGAPSPPTRPGRSSRRTTMRAGGPSETRPSPATGAG